MNFQFKSLVDLFKNFPDDASARAYFEKIKWNGTPTCPFCTSDKWYKLNDGKTYKCGNKECYKKYTVTVGTVFHGSHIPLNRWFAAMYLMSSHKKGISSHQLAKDLGITQKSAWHLAHRIREMVRDKNPGTLKGIVEADETYMGRKFRKGFKGMEKDEIEYQMKHTLSMGMVFGMIQREGKVLVRTFDRKSTDDLKNALDKYIEKHSFLLTDGAQFYQGKTSENFKHDYVIHSKKEYVKGDIHTNNIENFWSIMKRGIYGIYHQVSYRHLARYCDEFAFRHNNRKMPDNERFPLTLENVAGRLKYSDLIKSEPRQEERYKAPETEWD